MPDPRGRGKGDLLVQMNLDVPKKLAPREEELLRELAKEEKANVSPHRKTFLERLKDYFVQND
jgi:molecular chaperone DnaJ